MTRGTPVPGLKADGVQFALLRMALLATGHDIAVDFGEASASLRISEAQPALAGDPDRWGQAARAPAEARHVGAIPGGGADEAPQSPRPR